MTALSSALTTEQRLARVEDRQAVQELGILSGFVMDERDEAGIRRLFTDDATLDSGWPEARCSPDGSAWLRARI